MAILVDSNVVLDVATEDPVWFSWSSEALTTWAERDLLVINAVIYAEVSIAYDRIEELESVLPASYFRRDSIPWEAAFLAGKCFVKYRRRGGEKRSPLPDFFVGAHGHGTDATPDARQQALPYVLSAAGAHHAVRQPGADSPETPALPLAISPPDRRWSLSRGAAARGRASP